MYYIINSLWSLSYPNILTLWFFPEITGQIDTLVWRALSFTENVPQLTSADTVFSTLSTELSLCLENCLSGYFNALFSFLQATVIHQSFCLESMFL